MISLQSKDWGSSNKQGRRCEHGEVACMWGRGRGWRDASASERRARLAGGSDAGRGRKRFFPGDFSPADILTSEL